MKAVAAWGLVTMAAVGFVACGGATQDPNLQPPQQPGYGQPQPGYGQPQPGYGQPAPTTTAPAGQPTAPANPLALPCTSDASCGTFRCNLQAQRCAMPCTNSATDCQAGMACTMGVCGPAMPGMPTQ